MKTFNKIMIPILCGILLQVGSGMLYAQQVDISAMIDKARDAGIEETALTELQERADQRGMSDQQLSTIIGSAIEMAEANLPADAVINKTMEGLSKGIPGGRIVSVVGRVQESVGRAAEIIDPWMNNPEVNNMMERTGNASAKDQFRNGLAKAASKSLMQNMSPESLNDILSKIGSESVLSKTGPSDIVAAMQILSDIPAAGEQPGRSGDFVVRALKGGFKAEELQRLPSAIQMAQQRSELPAASVVEGIANQMQGGVPAKQILQNLFNGDVGAGPPGNIPGGLDNRPPDRGNGGNTNGNG